ncbi:uncharacterized protein LOC132306864 [Cornus florida]|uniref:uncharacterized protein LOC132306864 n=1 Tax=Cornus florida TaxID=4283 RepID=UPI00289E8B56|nr:uncharacterized protein LOC132306864 [Cornus florida]XP_059660418.1 uncharacterized protein LOC132306864 [Cornus florida]XP_059660419.1 uncharacterized protein LOC132306864 [Cornus florida]XP_059660420.1 uncharacterized protein LOC132306864 [Cornus florida]XP_059660421.1 uncharacterized protein LOC132306864 [Cornus florida]XP_059660422.1 uncharacterized protein LOC132306864 [Cornus florida]
MLGISYGELFLLIGATAALIGPKDLPAIARTAGRLAGRSIGYVQLARGQFENVMQQSQARQVHKELQDTIAQLEAIRYEIRTISFMNPGPMTRRLVDNLDQTSVSNVLGNSEPEKLNEESGLTTANTKDSSTTPGSSNMHSQATTYARLAESSSLNSGSMESKEIISELTNESGVTVLPVSAESTGLLPDRRDEAKGSDIVLEAILEAEVARNAKDFFAQPQNQIKCEQ